MAQLKNSTLSSGDIHSADTVISPGKCSPVLLLLINSFCCTLFSIFKCILQAKRYYFFSDRYFDDSSPSGFCHHSTFLGKTQ